MAFRIKCSDCGRKYSFNRDEDLAICPNPQCCKENPTGRESSIRRQIEKNIKLDIPAMTVGRAIGYAASIYEFATHNDRIDASGIEDRLAKKTGMATGMEKASLKLLATRANGGVVDNRTGLMIYVVSGQTNGAKWNTAYVVFRGSRGEAGGSRNNPQSAGWDDSSGQSHNIDWGANLTNAQVPAPWRPGVKVHKGFLEVYSSVRQIVHKELLQLNAQALPNMRFVCTGHSLGAALATLCAHDLQNSTSIRPFCYPFCPPKTGDLKFARDFDLHIASRVERLPESGSGYYSRGISFTEIIDPVSTGSKHAFKNIRSDRIQRVADLGATDGKLATIKQGIYAQKKTKSKVDIYYLAPNVHKVGGGLGLHSYKHMEKMLLGKR